MRVLALVQASRDTSPSQRFRIEQWDAHLKKEGIEIDYLPFLEREEAGVVAQPGRVLAKAGMLLAALLRRMRRTASARDYDLVYILRESSLFGPALCERVLAWRGIPFVFDFDDAVWVRYVSPVNSYYSFLRFPGKTAASCRLAREVMAGNSFLRDYATRYNDRVTIVPTTIDTDKYVPRPVREGGRPVIGWTGSHSTRRYLQIVRPVLERLRKRYDFRMVVVGAEGFSAEGVEVEHRPWRSATEVEDLSDFDIGLMPLADSEWERGKCGLKALVYMALGIPAVVSPVGVSTEIVKHGVNGLVAGPGPEWEEALGELLRDPRLRQRLGSAGRVRVEAGYSARAQAPRVADVLRAACS